MKETQKGRTGSSRGKSQSRINFRRHEEPEQPHSSVELSRLHLFRETLRLRESSGVQPQEALKYDEDDDDESIVTFQSFKGGRRGARTEDLQAQPEYAHDPTDFPSLSKKSLPSLSKGDFPSSSSKGNFSSSSKGYFSASSKGNNSSSASKGNFPSSSEESMRTFPKRDEPSSSEDTCWLSFSSDWPSSPNADWPVPNACLSGNSNSSVLQTTDWPQFHSSIAPSPQIPYINPIPSQSLSSSSIPNSIPSSTTAAALESDLQEFFLSVRAGKQTEISLPAADSEQVQSLEGHLLDSSVCGAAMYDEAARNYDPSTRVSDSVSSAEAKGFWPVDSSDPQNTRNDSPVVNTPESLDDLCSLLIPASISTQSVPSLPLGNCIICKTNPQNAMILECAHKFTCLDCTSRLLECPVCKRPITSIVKVYIS